VLAFLKFYHQGYRSFFLTSHFLPLTRLTSCRIKSLIYADRGTNPIYRLDFMIPSSEEFNKHKTKTILLSAQAGPGHLWQCNLPHIRLRAAGGHHRDRKRCSHL